MFPSFINKRNSREIEEISEYLEKNGVTYDNPEATVVMRDNGVIVATGSVDGNILKYFYNDEEYTGQGLMVDIYNELLNHLFDKQISDYYVFTKPKNAMIFNSIGLKTVYITDDVALFEGGFNTYSDWIAKVKEELNPNAVNRGAIVANCNPMTKGHKYLFEYARSQVDELVIFMVEEDKSIFPTIDRYEIVKREMSEYDDVVVLLGGPYIISSATFPTYFLKEEDDSLDIYTELDAKIFSEKIARDLEIKNRFVGSEPLDPVTNRYNEIMGRYVNRDGLKLVVLERLTQDDGVISATRVRKLLSEGKVKEAFAFLPNSTIEYLKSDRGMAVIEKLKSQNSSK